MNHIEEQLKEIVKSQEKSADWQKKHEEHDDRRFKEQQNALEKQQSALEKLPTHKDIEKIVTSAMIEFFKSKGKYTFYTITTIAVLIGALGVIGGGLKYLLALLGFSRMQ